MRTHRLATIAAASTVAVLAIGGTAFALGADDTPPPAATSTAATTAAASSSIGSARASAIAVGVGGGQVTHIERELEHGRVEWVVDLLRGNLRHEVRVDDATGAVVRDTGPAVSPSTAPRSAAPRSAAPPSAAPRSAAPAPVVRGDDGPLHDVGDDHGGRSGGVSGPGSDDGAAHDAGDDHGRHGGGHDG